MIKRRDRKGTTIITVSKNTIQTNIENLRKIDYSLKGTTTNSVVTES
jgi:hypothetical protein